MEMKYTVYRIINNINGKTYIGVHKTKNINDNYMGSGKILKRAQDKYGIENFTKEILAVFDNPEEMFEMESVLVNEDFVKDESTYNIKEGGNGGWDHISEDMRKHNKNKAHATLLKRYPSGTDGFKGKSHTNATKALISDVQKERYPNGTDGFKGLQHSQDSKDAIGAANKIHQSGKGNSQYGSMWIYSKALNQNKKIKKNDPIPEGWKKGRKINRLCA